MEIFFFLFFALLIFSGLIAHFVVQKYVTLEKKGYYRLWKFLIALALFLLLAYISIYFLANNFAFER